MDVFRSIEEISEKTLCSVLSIGMFDGVHKGHQKIIDKVVTVSRQKKCRSCLLTFDPHPRKYFQHHNGPLLITSIEHKLELFRKVGVDCSLIIDFDEMFSRLGAEEFICLLFEKLCFKGIVVGGDFRFGKNREGDSAYLKKLGMKIGFTVTEVSPFILNNIVVSSTEVRKAVQMGELEKSKELLGRDFSVLGTVIRGKNIGTRLGYPTANLDPHQEILPPGGVYIVRINLSGKTYSGLANVGYCPTFMDRLDDFSIEIYIFDFEKHIYGEHIEVFFLEKIREEKKFAAVENLVKQIKKDEKEARRYLNLNSDSL